ncbi:MAG: ComEC/Rec2 family competence protein, partial [Acidobacteriota bacterium]
MRERPFLIPAVALAVGTILGRQLLVESVLGCALSAGCLLLALRPTISGKTSGFLILLSLTVSGAVSVSVAAEKFPPRHIHQLLRKGWVPPAVPVPIRGMVYRPVETSPVGQRLYLELDRFGRDGRKISARVRLNLPPPSLGKESEVPRPGDLVGVSARLYPIRNFQNPGGFDYRTYLGARGIFLSGSVKSRLLVEIQKEGGFRPDRLIASFREKCQLRLEAGFEESPETLGLLEAILLGQRGGIPPEDEENLRRTGLYHLVAISGLHIGFWLWGCWGLLSCLGIPVRLRCVLCLPFLIFFPAFFGLRSSVLRAVLMAVPLMAGRFFYRRTDPLNALAFSGFVALLVNPLMLREAGWQLSYGATAGILLLAPRLKQVKFLGNYLGRLLGISLAAQVFTFPILAVHFFRFSPVGIVLNLIAVPAIAVLLLLGSLWFPAALLG